MADASPTAHSFLAGDGLTLAYHELGLGDYDLGGYSRGGAHRGEAQFEEYLRSTDADPVALIDVLDTLAAVFPHGQLRRVPGDHWSTLVSAELADEIAGFWG